MRLTLLLLFLLSSFVMAKEPFSNEKASFKKLLNADRMVNKKAQSFDLLWKADTLYAKGEINNDIANYYRPGDLRTSKVHTLLEKAKDGSVTTIPDGEYKSQYFVLNNKKNLTIKGNPGRVWLVSEDNLATIFILINCENITFEGIGFLHKVQGHCTGNSIDVFKSKNIRFNKCDISGCGVIGINANLVENLEVTNSYIHHCSYEMISLYNVRNAFIYNNLFAYNEERTTWEEGVNTVNVWGDIIIAQNSFYKNRCASIVFALERHEKTPDPLGDGNILVYRNLFNQNAAKAKEYASICDLSPNEPNYYANPSNYVILKENMLHQIPEYSGDEIIDEESDDPEAGYSHEEYDNDEEELTNDFIRGELITNDNTFQDLRQEDFVFTQKGIRYGISQNTIHWINISKDPELNE